MSDFIMAHLDTANLKKCTCAVSTLRKVMKRIKFYIRFENHNYRIGSIEGLNAGPQQYSNAIDTLRRTKGIFLHHIIFLMFQIVRDCSKLI